MFRLIRPMLKRKWLVVVTALLLMIINTSCQHELANPEINGLSSYSFDENRHIKMQLAENTTCHEMAHQRGFAREDEANYIAWVVCNSSGVAEFRYSGTLSALIYAMNALRANAPAKAGLLKQKYSPEVTRDLQDISEYWKKHQGRIEEVTSDINNAYLKSNRQEDGIRSYGRMVDLLLAEQKAEESKRFLP